MRHVVEVFPIPVLGYTLHTVKNNLEEIINHVKKDEQHHTGETGSFSLNQQVLRDPFFKPVVEEIHQHINDYVKFCNHDTKNIQIVSSWSNIVKRHEYIQPHEHANSYICGTIHLTKGSSLAFRKPNIKEWFQVDTMYKDPNDNLFFQIPANPAQLILFPSNVTHSVFDNKTDEERISIAFNTWPLEYGRATGEVRIVC